MHDLYGHELDAILALGRLETRGVGLPETLRISERLVRAGYVTRNPADELALASKGRWLFSALLG